MIRRLITLTLLLTTLLSPAPLAGQQPSTPDTTWRVHLRAGAFDPLLEAPPAAPTPALPTRMLSANQIGLRLVQFPGPIQDDWYQAMEEAGLQVVAYVPDGAYLVWGDGAAVAHLAAKAPLRWSGDFQPAYAVHPDLLALLNRPTGADASEEVEVVVQVFRHVLADQTIEAILKQASAVLRPPYDVLGYRNVGVRVPASALAAIAARPDVVNVEPRPVMRKRDELQNQIMAGALNSAGTQPSGPGYLAWLLSRGFSTDPAEYPIVDVTDDGIDNGTATPLHPDFYLFGQITQTDRLIYNTNWTSDPSADGRAGHGNINASIVAGYNDRTGFPYEDGAGYNYGLGVNPFGRVAGSKVFNNAGYWDLPGDNYTALISRTYALGGRISANSWGANTGGAYTTDDQAYDALVRDAQPGGGAFAGNQQITILFAAGNAGSAANTTASPGNAKNVITVGAAESVRPTWTDGCFIGPSGSDNAQDMASFSSRGPTDDQRVKPDLVAPGTHIQGAASQASGYDGSGVCDRYMPIGQTLYAASSGTSHSTPAVAGAASLVHYWYRTHHGGQPPSPAMTKAWLINATRYLTGTGAGGNLPSNSQGYGETLLSRAFDDTPRIVRDQTHLFGATGQVFQLQGQVADSSRPFRVTLAWTDAPGATIGNSYVNNLDLAVTVGGQTYRGNVFSGGQSVTGGSADPRNNVESVFLPAGLSGPFTVTITATNIAGDGVPGNSDPTDQDFALLVYNAAQATGTLNGTVHDGTLNAPLAGATVWVNGGPSLTTDAAGYFSATLQPGAYTVNAWKYGYTLQTQSPVSVIANAVTTLAFTLTQTALYSLTGQVTSAFTSAPLSATIQVYGPSGAWITQTSTVMPGGFYTLTLPGGLYTVTAQALLHQSGATSVNLTGDQTQNFALTPLTANGLLWGYVTSLANGNPIAGAQVQVAPGLTSTLTAGDGYYEILLPPGAYVVTASASLHSPATATVVIPPSNLTRQDFALGSASMMLIPSDGLSATLYLGQQATQTLVISNAGTGALQATLIEGRSAVSGGPDAFGYTWSDSLSGNAQYQWVDATDGTALALSAEAVVNITLPFPFTFYGVSATALRIGNNGAALFNATTGNVPFFNEPLATTSVNNLIAPFWDDLDDETGAVYYKTVGVAPNRRFVVQWHDRPHYDNIGAMTAQMILYEGTNNLKFQYQDVIFGDPSFDRGASATVGIRQHGANYLQYSYNQAVLTDSMAICFRYPGAPDCDSTDIPWLTLAPTNVVVAPGGVVSISFVLDAAAVSSTGVYTGWVSILNNDPANQPARLYPVTMTVLAPPPFLSALSKTVSALYAGLPATYTIIMSNSNGPASQVTLTDALPANTTFITASHGGILQGDQVVWSGLNVPANGMLSVTLTVQPACVPSGTLIVNDAYTATAAGSPPLIGQPVTATLSEIAVTADFTHPVPALAQWPVSFTNQSQNALSYLWDFGDGVTSTATSPGHTYAAPGLYTVALTAVHTCSSAVLSRTIVVEDYAAAWQPITSALSAPSGQVVTHALYLTNTGTLSAAFVLSPIGHTWPTTITPPSVALAAGQGQLVQVAVGIPSSAPGGSQSAGQVRAQALGDPRTPPASATARVTTTVQTFYSVTLSISPPARSGLVGQVVTYTARFTNTGNVPDTIALTRANGGWPTVVAPASQTVAAGGVRTAIISVTVPLTATVGEVDAALIRAQGNGAPVQAGISTRAIAPAVFVPVARKD